MSKYFYADGAIHHDHHKEWTLNVTSKTDLVALMKEMMKDEVEDAMEVTEEVQENDLNFSKKTEIPESVKACFRIANDYVREQVKAIVNDFYLGQSVNLAMIEVTLFDHGQLQKRNSHKIFVRALIDWDILPKDTDINKTSTGMASKLRSTFPTKGYKQWDKFHLNERNLCANIGNRLPESMKYNRNE